MTEIEHDFMPEKQFTKALLGDVQRSLGPTLVD